MAHHKPTNLLLLVVVAWAVLLSAGPTLALLIEAAIPLIIVLGIVIAALRLVHFHTRKW